MTTIEETPDSIQEVPVSTQSTVLKMGADFTLIQARVRPFCSHPVR